MEVKNKYFIFKSENSKKKLPILSEYHISEYHVKESWKIYVVIKKGEMC